jgi:hypothetical protein
VHVHVACEPHAFGAVGCRRHPDRARVCDHGRAAARPDEVPALPGSRVELQVQPAVRSGAGDRRLARDELELQVAVVRVRVDLQRLARMPFDARAHRLAVDRE